VRFRWSSDLTYYHRQYTRWYREIENKEFEELAKKEVSARTRLLPPYKV